MKDDSAQPSVVEAEFVEKMAHKFDEIGLPSWAAQIREQITITEAQPREDVLGEAAPVEIPAEVYEFLMGQGPLRGCHFGEKPEDERGKFWWRKDLARIQRALAAGEGK